jgi:hypothetical protein
LALEARFGWVSGIRPGFAWVAGIGAVAVAVAVVVVVVVVIVINPLRASLRRLQV